MGFLALKRYGEEVENMKFNSRIVLELMKEELEARDLI